MTKSFCHFDTIPSDMMDIIEADLTDTFDEQMQTSRLMGNAEVLEKRNSTNAWVPTTCLLYTSPSPRDLSTSRMPSSA